LRQARKLWYVDENEKQESNSAGQPSGVQRAKYRFMSKERSMNMLKHVFFVALSALTLVSINSANAEETNASVASVGVLALGGAGCGDARLCAYIGQNGFVLRSKNVAAVTNPSIGVVCIKPKAGVLNINTIVPSVTVEWGASLGNDLLAFFEHIKVGCPAGTIEVRTYDLAGNLNPRVAFTIVAD
jgi:hypothetical protein